jgi:ABC-type lipoprotein release transport system permease subunit
MSAQLSILKVITEGRASKRFLVASIVSFGFSIGVILSTIGLMDGFEHTLRSALKKSNSDFTIYSRDGFFFAKDLNHLSKGYSTTAILQTQAFAVGENNNRGVLVKGIEAYEFNDVTSMDIKLNEFEIAIGNELAKEFNLQIKDKILLAFASSKKQDQGSAILKRYVISDIIDHGIYEKDLRVVYLNKNELAELLGYKTGTSNKYLVKASKELGFESSQFDIERNLTEEFSLAPFWDEYKTLINAVEVEKNSITLILQIIVIVSIFNILAFIIFIFEKKSQDFFLLRALGLSVKLLNRFWIKLLIGIWFFACCFAFALAHLFDYILSDLQLFRLPGDIYVLNQLKLVLTLDDYIIVFLASLIWIVLIGLLTNYRLRKRSLLAGLRQEFR